MDRLRTLLVVVLVLCIASTIEAAITSRLEGRAVDDQDRPLAGVEVTISSDSLIGGPQTAVTSEEGGFAFHLLPVGIYTIDAGLVGYTPATATARVQLDRTAVVTLRLVRVTFAEEIEVTADVPIIDPARTNTGEVFTEQYLQLTSIGSEGRDYLAIMDQAAGVRPGFPQEVFGATRSENAYLVDGFNTVDPSTGGSATRFNFDAIEEASVLTGGAAAEFGWGTGGILNVVTKSGGNRFSGTFDARYSDENFIESGDHFDPGEDTFSNRVLSATLGGPILRDRLWFFVAVDNWQERGAPEGAPVTKVRDANSFLGKLTWAINRSNRLMARLSTTPTTIDYAAASRYRTPEATIYVDRSEPIGQLELNSVFSDRLLLTASLGFSRESASYLPMINDVDTPPEYDIDQDLLFSNNWQVEEGDRNRDHHRAKLTWFAGEALGPHQLDAGFEYHKLQEEGVLFTPGGYAIEYFNNAYRDPPWPDGDGDGLVDVDLWRDYPFQTARDPWTGEAQGWSAFAQDQWRPIPQLTVNLGLRYDMMAHTNTVGQTIADFDKWQPRVGIAWDLGNRGRHVLRGSWGRYMHPGLTNFAMLVSGMTRGYEVYLGLDLLCGAYGICDRDTAAAAIGPELIHVDGDGDEHPFYLDFIYSSTPAETLDTLGIGRLRVPYRDELILAYEARVARETSLELSYVNMTSHDLIEDTCNNNTWAWGDGEPPSIDDPSTWTDEAACTGSVRANMPGLKNQYEALALRAASRARPWFHLLGSYTYSKQRVNNYSQPYSGFGTGFDWFPAAAFDYFPTNFVNRDGDLEFTEHWLKINGYFFLPLEFAIGVGATYFSSADVGVYSDCGDLLFPNDSGLVELERLGIDYDEMVQYCQSPYSGELLLDTQTGPRTNVWQLDLQLSKVFHVGSVRLTPIVSVFNVSSEEAVTDYTTDPFGPFGYGTAESWQDPRRWEIGFRVEF
jgi:hypothetical protein